MIFQASLLSTDEKHRIHAESLRILAEVGVKITHDAPLRLLEAHGARVDWDAKTARIPETMVARALETVPKTLTLGARNPQHAFAMPSPVSAYSLDGTGTYALDFETGERRYGTRRDIELGARIFQAMDTGVMVWPPTCASDAPAASRVLHEFITLLKFTSKHCEHELHSIEEVPYLIEALRLILGSEDAIREQKIVSVTYCPVAPLVHEGPMCAAYLELVEYDIPILVLPMPAPGTTAPASLYSSVCLATAEALSSLVIFQCARPGSPQIFGSAAGAVDFRNGNFLEGAPEMVLQTAAMAEMGRFYNLPNTAAGCLTDAKTPGPDALLEKLLTTIPLVMAGVDIIEGLGEIESSQTLVLEQLVVDNEIAHLCRRLREGVDCSPARDFNADLAKFGPGGNFLASRNTLKAPRGGEFYLPRLIDRSPYEAWLGLSKPDVYTKARDVVRGILESPVVDPLPDAVTQSLDDLLAEADKSLA